MYDAEKIVFLCKQYVLNYVWIYRVRTVHEQSVYMHIYVSICSCIRQERVLCVRMALPISTHVCTYGQGIYQHLYIDMHVFMHPREYRWRGG